MAVPEPPPPPAAVSPKPEARKAASAWQEVGAGASSPPPLRSKDHLPKKEPERSPWERSRENFTADMQQRQDEKRQAKPPILLNENPAGGQVPRRDC